MFIPFDPSQVTLLKGVCTDEIKRMLSTGELFIKSYPKSSVVHHANDSVESLEIIIMGEVYESNPQQDSIRIIGLYESPMITICPENQPRYKYDAIAHEDSLLLYLPIKTTRKLMLNENNDPNPQVST
jgi:signal-transduction protein with cAMP-binding, CBS, and nucleotidyltransferase domain